MKSGAKTYVLKDIPHQEKDLPRLINLAALHRYDIEKVGVSPKNHEVANEGLHQIYQEIAQMGAVVLDPADCFLNRFGLYGVVRDDRVLYCDQEHLTVDGSKVMAPLFDPIFRGESSRDVGSK